MQRAVLIIPAFCLICLITGCASTGTNTSPSRLEAARTFDEMMQARTKRFAERVGPGWESLCLINPNDCQLDPHANERAVPVERRDDRGFWADFMGRVDDLKKAWSSLPRCMVLIS